MARDAELFGTERRRPHGGGGRCGRRSRLERWGRRTGRRFAFERRLSIRVTHGPTLRLELLFGAFRRGSRGFDFGRRFERNVELIRAFGARDVSVDPAERSVRATRPCSASAATSDQARFSRAAAGIFWGVGCAPGERRSSAAGFEA